MKSCWPWIMFGAALYFYNKGYRMKHAEEAIEKIKSIKPLKEPLPQGSVPTGRTTTTSNGSRPGDVSTRIGYVIREFAEVVLPDGTLDWLEVDRRGSA